MERIAIVGAGLVGSLQAIVLAKKGYTVDVFERRLDMRQEKISAGKSINLALSNRGWKALKLAEVDKEVEKMAIPMYGRVMHDVNGGTTFQQYGKDGEAIFSVSRAGLNMLLMNEAEKLENVNFYFQHKCENVNFKSNELSLVDSESGEKKLLSYDKIIGTDGAFSAVRQKMQKTDRFNYQQFYLDHGYKELFIPAGKNNSYLLDKNALHIWPRGEYMLIALANEDGSFTCTLFFPFEGATSFQSIDNKEKLFEFFKSTFADALELMPTLEQDYFGNPTSSLVTVKCSPWNLADKVLLMGDSSHAIVPFYGQGMNSGFEDVSIFDEIFENNQRNWVLSFKEFSKTRKKDADAIADLALQNFIEMRDLVADEMFLLRKKIEKKIYAKHPKKWMPLYSQVTFSHIPYSEALKKGKEQEKIMDEIMKTEGIRENWDSQEIENQILALL